jgi:hypothetical protein
MYSVRDLGEVLTTTGRILTFQSVAPDLKRLGPLYLVVGLVFAWLAGIGRHWDNPRLPLWEHLGLDSVGYVFVLSSLLWLSLWPMRPSNWRYTTVLIFVALTSPPAFLYALPSLVMSAHNVLVAKVLLLALVAIWRVALLIKFLSSPSFGFSTGGQIFVATFLPLVLIVVALTSLNLDRAVFDVMGERTGLTVDDGAYAVLGFITFISILAFPFLLLGYLWICWTRWRSGVAEP